MAPLHQLAGAPYPRIVAVGVLLVTPVVSKKLADVEEVVPLGQLAIGSPLGRGMSE